MIYKYHAIVKLAYQGDKLVRAAKPQHDLPDAFLREVHKDVVEISLLLTLAAVAVAAKIIN